MFIVLFLFCIFICSLKGRNVVSVDDEEICLGLSENEMKIIGDSENVKYIMGEYNGCGGMSNSLGLSLRNETIITGVVLSPSLEVKVYGHWLFSESTKLYIISGSESCDQFSESIITERVLHIDKVDFKNNNITMLYTFLVTLDELDLLMDDLIATNLTTRICYQEREDGDILPADLLKLDTSSKSSMFDAKINQFGEIQVDIFDGTFGSKLSKFKLVDESSFCTTENPSEYNMVRRFDGFGDGVLYFDFAKYGKFILCVSTDMNNGFTHSSYERFGYNMLLDFRNFDIFEISPSTKVPLLSSILHFKTSSSTKARNFAFSFVRNNCQTEADRINVQHLKGNNNNNNNNNQVVEVEARFQFPGNYRLCSISPKKGWLDTDFFINVEEFGFTDIQVVSDYSIKITGSGVPFQNFIQVVPENVTCGAMVERYFYHLHTKIKGNLQIGVASNLENPLPFSTPSKVCLLKNNTFYDSGVRVSLPKLGIESKLLRVNYEKSTREPGLPIYFDAFGIGFEYQDPKNRQSEIAFTETDCSDPFLSNYSSTLTSEGKFGLVKGNTPKLLSHGTFKICARLSFFKNDNKVKWVDTNLTYSFLSKTLVSFKVDDGTGAVMLGKTVRLNFIGRGLLGTNVQLTTKENDCNQITNKVLTINGREYDGKVTFYASFIMEKPTYFLCHENRHPFNDTAIRIVNTEPFIRLRPLVENSRRMVQLESFGSTLSHDTMFKMVETTKNCSTTTTTTNQDDIVFEPEKNFTVLGNFLSLPVSLPNVNMDLKYCYKTPSIGMKDFKDIRSLNGFDVAVKMNGNVRVWKDHQQTEHFKLCSAHGQFLGWFPQIECVVSQSPTSLPTEKPTITNTPTISPTKTIPTGSPSTSKPTVIYDFTSQPTFDRIHNSATIGRETFSFLFFLLLLA